MKFCKIALCAVIFLSLTTVESVFSQCCPGHGSETASQSTTAANAASVSEAGDSESVAVQPQAAVKPKMLEFGSKQCKACKAMEPVMENLKKSHSEVFDIEFVDVWLPENQMFAKSYSISSIPTQVFLNSAGKEVSRNTGFFSEESILTKWRELGVDVDAKAPDAPAITASEEPIGNTQENGSD
jgi:thioredoxin 1